MSRIFNRRTFPVIAVALNAIGAGNAWAWGDHWQAMFGLGVAGFLSLDIVRTEARIGAYDAERRAALARVAEWEEGL
jgi:hypothetical protein